MTKKSKIAPSGACESGRHDECRVASPGGDRCPCECHGDQRPLASIRDASFSNHPGYANRYHLMGENGISRCSSMIWLIGDSAVYAEQVEPMMRCQRAGCRNAWPAYKPNRPKRRKR